LKIFLCAIPKRGVEIFNWIVRSGVGFGDCLDAGGNLFGALFCHLQTAEVAAVADSLSRLQGHRLRLAHRSRPQRPHSTCLQAETHKGQRYVPELSVSYKLKDSGISKFLNPVTLEGDAV
jgi:hypothetical protein